MRAFIIISSQDKRRLKYPTGVAVEVLLVQLKCSVFQPMVGRGLKNDLQYPIIRPKEVRPATSPMSSIQPNQSPSSMPSPSQAPEQSATVALSPHVLLMFPVCFLVGILCGRYLLSDYEGKSAQEWHTIAQQYMDKYSNSQKEQILQSQSTAQLDICLAGAESDYEAAILLNGKVVTGEDGQEHVRAERRIFDGASKDLERERDLCFRRFK